MVVRALGPDDVDIFRLLRLEALEADPQAFSSSFEIEAALDDGTWSERINGFAGRIGRILVDELDGQPAAMAGIGLTEAAGTAILWGMWVRPAARRQGAGARLVDAAIEWAANLGASEVMLHVAYGNDSAYRLYERFGFQDIGEFAANPDDPCYRARLMRLELDQPPTHHGRHPHTM